MVQNVASKNASCRILSATDNICRLSSFPYTRSSIPGTYVFLSPPVMIDRNPGILILNAKSIISLSPIFLPDLLSTPKAVKSYILWTIIVRFHSSKFDRLTEDIVLAELSPVNTTVSEEISPKMAAIRMLRLLSSFSFLQQKPGADAQDEYWCEQESWKYSMKEFVYCHRVKENCPEAYHLITGSIRVKSHATGFCIQAFATSIHNAERLAPTATSQVEVRWNFLLTLFQPKNITATNVDSRKNASIPQSPEEFRRYRQQTMSNSTSWFRNSNSSIMPVAIPMAKLIPKVSSRSVSAFSIPHCRFWHR